MGLLYIQPFCFYKPSTLINTSLSNEQNLTFSTLDLNKLEGKVFFFENYEGTVRYEKGSRDTGVHPKCGRKSLRLDPDDNARVFDAGKTRFDNNTLIKSYFNARKYKWVSTWSTLNDFCDFNTCILLISLTSVVIPKEPNENNLNSLHKSF